MTDIATLNQRCQTALLNQLNPQGHWTGYLSSSPLATALAIYTLNLIDSETHAPLIKPGLNWLIHNSNPDSSWGDTTDSPGNLSTTLITLAALNTIAPHEHAATIKNTQRWLATQTKSESPQSLITAVHQKYKDDHTFASPILSVCALAGLLGPTRPAFAQIKPLPFEIALLPHAFYKIIKLPVVSYALPALIALGQLQFHQHKPTNPITRLIRHAARRRTLKKLQTIQPNHGGFLEAVPLTAFVALSLTTAGQSQSPITPKCRLFIIQSARPDGSWPIDTNLATWLTTLAINALTPADPTATSPLTLNQRQNLHNWLIDQQFTNPHPYTAAPPGGWSWTNLPGAVPDADDTAGALLALANLDITTSQTLSAVANGITWLLNLQNPDGGIPTFCRGWNKLDFDRSAPDLTAHALAALNRWQNQLNPNLKSRIQKFTTRALQYLQTTQDSNNLWTPLWFGNEHLPHQTNPVFGTARVISHLCDPRLNLNFPPKKITDALETILKAQNPDHGWGRLNPNQSSIEETAAVLDALATAQTNPKLQNQRPNLKPALKSALDFLTPLLTTPTNLNPAPIGLYFAKLWYHEKLYPLIFAAAALNKLHSTI